MRVRVLFAFLALPVMVAGVVPWLLAPVGDRLWSGTALAALPILFGVAVLVASAVSFARRGKGTLAPWDPPRKLVVQDLYRYTRNPMYVGVISIVVGWALATGGVWNLAHALVLPLVFHLRVVLYEEREMRRLFGEEWERYRDAVPRWGVRLRPYEPR